MLIDGVSVVMAVYNGKKHVKEAIESVVSQSYRDIELIVIDDGSADDSSEHISQFLQELKPPFPYKIARTTNSGQGAARNLGASMAQKGLLAFLDQDDVWREDYLLQAVQKFSGSDWRGLASYRGWVSTNFSEINDEGKQIRWSFLGDTHYVEPNKDIVSLIRANLMMLPTATVFNKKAFELVGGFDTRFRGYEDDDLLIRMFLEGWDFEFVGFPHVKYRIHDGNSSGESSFLTSRIRFYHKAVTYLGDNASDQTRNHFLKFLRQRMILDTLRDSIRASKETNKAKFIQARDFLNELLHTGDTIFSEKVLWLFVRTQIGTKLFVHIRAVFSQKFRNKIFTNL